MRTPRTVLATAVALAAAVCTPFLTAPTAAAAPAKLADDFNGDGYRDFVMLGGTHGKDGRDDVDLSAFFHRGGSSFARRAHEIRVPDDGGHQIGGGPVTAIGDFDKDGYGDLAIGRGYERPDGERGYVTVHYGGSSGPNASRKPVKFTQDTAGVPGASEKEDHFGAAIAAADVNGDGYADLAVGAPGEDLEGKRRGGMVTVLLGRAGGLSGTGAKTYHQNTSGITGAVENDDCFGQSLKLTDYTRDGRADLVVDTNDQLDNTRWGLVHLLKGSKTGTTGTGSKSFTVNSLKLSYKTLGGPFPY